MSEIEDSTGFMSMHRLIGLSSNLCGRLSDDYHLTNQLCDRTICS